MKEGKPEQSFSHPKELIGASMEELGEAEEGLAELGRDLAEGEKMLKEILEDNKFAREMGFEEFSSEEIESIKMGNESLKKVITALEDVRSRYEALIHDLHEIDKKMDDFFESHKAIVEQ